MNFAAHAFFVLNFIVTILCDVSTVDNQEPKIKLQENRRLENSFDYWDIDHNVASAIYYEPADLTSTKTFELNKKFFISNPRTSGSPNYSLDKTQSSTTKEKRNLLSQNTDTDECVNDTSIDESSNVLLDVDISSSPHLRNSDTDDLTAELLAIDDIHSTEKKLAECIDLHLFKNRDVIENWQLLLTEGKIQMYSLLNQTDIDKEIQKKCKHLEDIIAKNLDMLKRSMPKRNKVITTESTKAKISANKANILLAKEDTMAKSDDQTHNPLSDLSTDSSKPASQHEHGNPSKIPSNFSALDETPTTEINNIKIETVTEKSELQSGNPSNASVNDFQNIDDKNQNYRRSNSLEPKPKGNQAHEIAYEESQIKIPKIVTKELLNGSVISEANGTESLPNDDFKDFDTAKKESFITHTKNVNSSVPANNLNITETKEEKLDEETTPAASDSDNSATYFITEPTPPVDYSDSFSYTIASTEKVIAKDFDFGNENNITDSFNNMSRYIGKLSAEDYTANDGFTASTTDNQMYETTSDKEYILRASDDPQSSSKGTSSSSSSSLNGTLFFNFNGNLVPTHFVQNAEGSINIAIDGKSFCDNLMEKLQSVILLAICKSNYITSNSTTVVKTSEP